MAAGLVSALTTGGMEKDMRGKGSGSSVHVDCDVSRGC